MGISNYDDLLAHFGHDVEISTYGDGVNVALECNDCMEVLLDYDKPATTPCPMCEAQVTVNEDGTFPNHNNPMWEPNAYSSCHMSGGRVYFS